MCHFLSNFADMKNQRIILLFLGLIALSIVGCHHVEPNYDSRLVAADSFLRCNKPDSALQLLHAIDARSLSGDGNCAYHALLLTQAQYRCYEDITSDSVINIASDYYQQHAGEREKLTRAYIYKGALMDVLGFPEAAMTHFKQAVATAAPDDHFNLGYALLRIGCLYRDCLVADSSYIGTLKEALCHFSQIPDSLYVMNCLSTLGNSYAAWEVDDSALVYLERADMLAKAMQQTAIEQLNLEYIADLKMFSHDVNDIVQAKDIALSLLAGGDFAETEHEHLLLVASYTLARLHKPDSASYYLNQVEKNHLSDGSRVLYNYCFAELAICHGDMDQFRSFFQRADDISDSLLSNSMQRQLRDVEAKYDNESLKYQTLKYRTNWLLSLLGVALAICALAIVVMVMRRMLASRQRQLRENEDTIERLNNDIGHLTAQLNANQVMSEDLKQTIRHQIEVFSDLIEMHSTQSAYSPKKFSDKFERAYRMNLPDNSFWEGIRAYADSQLNGIITRTIEDHPLLSETDVNFLSLYCIDLPTTVIMACMGYREPHSAYNKKRRVAKTLGYENDLDDYVLLFKDSGL